MKKESEAIEISDKKMASMVNGNATIDTNSKDHNHITFLSGACKVSGCGCQQYKDNGGTCWNLNSAGGTCNHLESDHN